MSIKVKIVWTAQDVKTLKPDWTLEQCEEWLEENSRSIEEHSIEHGWEVIQSLID